mgnify:CR=1 FL=1
MTSFQLIIMGFAGVILLGTVLLMLPFSSAEKVITPFHEALFTATSAVCVTGLVVKDTGSYWSLAGQTIILALIQTGGLGVVTVAASVSLLSGKENIPHAKKHHAGCNFSSKSRRNRQTDKVYFEGNIFDRSCRDGVAAAGFYGRLWKKGNLDVSFSFNLCFL